MQYVYICKKEAEEHIKEIGVHQVRIVSRNLQKTDDRPEKAVKQHHNHQRQPCRQQAGHEKAAADRGHIPPSEGHRREGAAAQAEADDH